MMNWSSGPFLRRGRLLLVLSISLIVAACGQVPAPADPDPDPDPGPAACRQQISSDITVPARLVNGGEGCDYLVTELITVTAPLDIEPGTVIEFAQDTRLHVTDGGSIRALGGSAAADRIVMRGQVNATGYWYGLCFSGNRASRLQNVTILGAGKVWDATYRVCSAAISGTTQSGEPVDITGTLVAGSHTSGIDASKFVLGEFSGNVLAANEEFGMRVSADQLHLLDAATDYLGTAADAPNSRSYVWVAGTFSAPGESYTWPRLNAPYYVGRDTIQYQANLNIEGVRIRILPGTQFFFAPEARFGVINGAFLEARGTAEQPVIFTAVEPGSPGSWEGVLVSRSGLDMAYTGIYWGGSSVANLVLTGVEVTQPLNIESVHLAGSASRGLSINSYVLQSGMLTESGITYADNVAGDRCTR